METQITFHNKLHIRPFMNKHSGDKKTSSVAIEIIDQTNNIRKLKTELWRTRTIKELLTEYDNIATIFPNWRIDKISKNC
jgi:hypothetical protein